MLADLLILAGFIVVIAWGLVRFWKIDPSDASSSNPGDSAGQSPATDDAAWWLDPLYSRIPGNIYHDTWESESEPVAAPFSDNDWRINPACAHLPGNIYNQGTDFGIASDYWITDPVYSYLPGNLYHNNWLESSSSDLNADWITDPIYSYMSCNIFYSDDRWSSTDDSWDLSTDSCSSSDDSFSSLSSNSWNSSSDDN